MSSTNDKPTAGSFTEKSLSSENSTVYCLCQSSDCSTFMIACDSCNIWYHGSCIGISEKESAKIENFFCHRCRNKNPLLQIKYNRSAKEIEEKLKKCIRKRLKKEIQLLDPTYISTVKVNDSSSISQRKSREHSSSLDTWTHEDSTSNQSDSSSSSTARTLKIQSVQYETLTSRDDQELIAQKNSIESSSNSTNRRSLITKNTSSSFKTSEKRRREHSNNGSLPIKQEPREENDTKNNNGQRRIRRNTEQCYGPGCVYEARPLSKYCSDKCGLELARNRLLQFLPVRLMQWQTIPSVADTLNRNVIEEIRTEIETIKQRLATLEDRRQALEEIVERGKQLKAVKETNKLEINNDEHDWTCFCVLCNQEVNQKSYQRHIDKCFIRFESQVSYGSNVKSNIEGLFCDTYDRTNNLYCKRLKVICPEHAREPKVAADEACGCPLEKNLFELSDELCLTPKRLCSKHFKWDRKRRAQIDLERLHELMRLEELIEKENRLRAALQERGSVAGLLLHKTTVH